MMLRCFLAILSLLVASIFFSGCVTADAQSSSTARASMLEEIKKEKPGNYYVGRRYYKADYKFWGFIRRPGESWAAAKLVMLNEQQRLAPDRALGKLGADNNYEYKLLGEFSGQTVYEPASNGFYPEFVLRGYEVKAVAPASIFRTPGATDPQRRIIAKPY